MKISSPENYWSGIMILPAMRKKREQVLQDAESEGK